MSTEQHQQMTVNVLWLVGQIDRIHAALCPGQMGTWQERATQAVEAAERIAANAEQ